MIDLLNITPHEVSRDLKGYTVMLYGQPKQFGPSIRNYRINIAEKIWKPKSKDMVIRGEGKPAATHRR